VLAVRGEVEAAAQLLGASDRLLAKLGAHVEATEQATYEHAVEKLLEQSFALARGRRLLL
jgi:hypothetical protein